MSLMLADIRRIVNEDISSRVNQLDVLRESILNSIHANATKVVCKLQSVDGTLEDKITDMGGKKVDLIVITDNGEGMTKENYQSFCKYRSEYKKKYGAKGIGRFVFLKLYQKIKFKSLVPKEGVEKNFTFDLDFDTDNISETATPDITEGFTEVSFSALTPQYLTEDRTVDRRIELNLKSIRDEILGSLIPTLFFYKAANISIEFTDGNKSEFITEDDIPDFKETHFQILGVDSLKRDFKLNYIVESTIGELKAYYCASDRAVCTFAEKDFKLNLPYGYSAYFLLESREYLDVHINLEKNNFDIYPVETNLYYPISWDMINSELKNVISLILKSGIKETEDINKKKLKEIQEARPYLIPYIQVEDLDLAGFMDEKSVIKKAKERFDIAKENVIRSSGKQAYSEAELDEAIQLAQNELVSYIHDRVQVIERLKTMIDNKEKVEKVIHNLFMTKNTTDDYYFIGKNNLWLLDDRYTSYSYAASDKRISDVLNDIGSTTKDVSNPDDKPDLSLFFSHTPLDKKSLKSVLVEIKPFDYDTKASRKKFAGLKQLIDYVIAFKKSEHIAEIWAFLITDVDEEFKDALLIDDYVPLFSTEAPMYHRYFQKLGISIYVVSARTLIIDAEARNKIFLDIIKKQSRLNALLDKNSTTFTVATGVKTVKRTASKKKQ